MKPCTLTMRHWAGTIPWAYSLYLCFCPSGGQKKELPWRPLGCLETPVNQVRNSRETKRLTLTSSREAAEAALLPDSGELTPDYTRLLFHTDQNSSLSFID